MKTLLKKHRLISCLVIFILVGLIARGVYCVRLYIYGNQIYKQTIPMSPKEFEISMGTFSTAPFYVLVNIKHPTGEIKPVCMESWQLYYAFQEEYDKDINKDMEFLFSKAMQQKDLTFSFSKLTIYQELEPCYNKMELAEAQLFFEECINDRQLQKFLDNRGWPLECMAHILIKNNYMMRRGCVWPKPFIYRLTGQSETNEPQLQLFDSGFWKSIEPNEM